MRSWPRAGLASNPRDPVDAEALREHEDVQVPAARQQVVFGTADQAIVAVAAVQHVIARTANQEIITCAAFDPVLAGPTAQNVFATCSINHIISSISMYQVRVIGAIKTGTKIGNSGQHRHVQLTLQTIA